MESYASESRLFSSEEEARKACDELNSNLKEQINENKNYNSPD